MFRFGPLVPVSPAGRLRFDSAINFRDAVCHPKKSDFNFH